MTSHFCRTAGFSTRLCWEVEQTKGRKWRAFLISGKLATHTVIIKHWWSYTGPLNVSFPHPLLPWVQSGTPGPTPAGTSSQTPAMHPGGKKQTCINKNYAIINLCTLLIWKKKKRNQPFCRNSATRTAVIHAQRHICMHVPGGHGKFGFMERFYQSLQLQTSIWVCPCVCVCLRVLFNLSGIFPLEHFDTERVHLMWQQLGMPEKAVFCFF